MRALVLTQEKTSRLQRIKGIFEYILLTLKPSETPQRRALASEVGLTAMVRVLNDRIEKLEREAATLTDSTMIQSYQNKIAFACQQRDQLQVKIRQDEDRGYKGNRQGDEATLSSLESYFKTPFD